MRFLRSFALPWCLLAGVGTSGTAQAQSTSTTAADSARRTERLLGHALTRPRKAVLLALMLPGAGQLYNRRWWKLPLVYGALGGVGYGLHRYQTLYREYADGRRALNKGASLSELSGANVSQEPTGHAVSTGLDFYRTRRDTFIGYAGVAYGVVVLDALVDAHLHAFDVSENLAVQVRPVLLPAAFTGVTPGLQLRMALKTARHPLTAL